MAGHYAESDVSQAVRQGFITGKGGAWETLTARVEALPAYREQFDKVIGPRPLHPPRAHRRPLEDLLLAQVGRRDQGTGGHEPIQAVTTDSPDRPRSPT
jgi:hypothetical protein